MMTNWTPTETRKFAKQLVIGMVVGAAFAAAFFGLGEQFLPLNDTGGMVGAVTGLVYVVLALALGLGLMAPSAGAHFLNVEDAEELREQRAMLIKASGSMALSGTFLILLATSERLVAAGASPFAIAALAGFCLLGAVILGLKSAALYDELMRQISAEASVLTLYAVTLIYGSWAALAHLGMIQWVGPVGLIAGLAIIQLAAAFWVVGRRGMLKPR